jgi:hypothetical protein
MQTAMTMAALTVIFTHPSHVAVSGKKDNAKALISLQFRNAGCGR